MQEMNRFHIKAYQQHQGVVVVVVVVVHSTSSQIMLMVSLVVGRRGQ
jgi:hypothetical protein